MMEPKTVQVPTYHTVQQEVTMSKVLEYSRPKLVQQHYIQQPVAPWSTVTMTAPSYTGANVYSTTQLAQPQQQQQQGQQFYQPSDDAISA